MSRDPRFADTPVPLDVLAKEAEERKSGDFTVRVFVWFTASPGDSVAFIAGRTTSRKVASDGAKAWAQKACDPTWIYPDKDGQKRQPGGLTADIVDLRGEIVESWETQLGVYQCAERVK